MSKPSFVYCFTKKLAANNEEYNISLKVLSDSINLLSKHYDFRLVTDKVTYDDLKSLSNNISFADTDDFLLVDDFKIQQVKHLKDNEVLVDPDILIYSPLEIYLTDDLIFDYKDRPYEKWYTQNKDLLEGTLLNKKIQSSKTPGFIPNIGFLKINNSILLNDYISQYEMYRKDIIQKLSNKARGLSIMLGQFLLGLLLSEGKYSYLSTRGYNTGQVYVHLGGPQKFKKYNSKKSVI